MREAHLIAFVLWLVLWPLACAWRGDYLRRGGNLYPDNVRLMSALFDLAVWLVVGFILIKH
ncbi:MAG: hypothetical protein CFK52_13980 [Chloracidobacterium sp. CP2_5A]|nr:MAG: hypothetical protein CFK52_13980 [Chloracidobacterium sp. CP2_5A]